MFAILTKNYDVTSSDSQGRKRKLYNVISLTLTHSQTKKGNCNQSNQLNGISCSNMCKLNKRLKTLNLFAAVGSENLISDEGAVVAPRQIG